MNAVIQEEPTGCGIASSAAIAGLSYFEARTAANAIGIYARDESLWSDTAYVRRLLEQLGVSTAEGEPSFTDWNSLPDCALLPIKWHEEDGVPYWHWVVFVRDEEGEYVLDSKQGLKSHRRTDLWRMKPKWFIEVFR